MAYQKYASAKTRPFARAIVVFAPTIEVWVFSKGYDKNEKRLKNEKVGREKK